jgi:predicted glycoside hydrolase/deacetylase ChbG (UPF0249 family)
MTRIILNGDDFGMSDGVCQSIRELLDRGAISNTTIMTVLPDGHERLIRWGASDLLGLAGVHLQLSGGMPLSNPASVSSLLDPFTQRFRPRPQIEDAEPADVAREWRAQIESAARLLGGSPTHLDSHLGYHRNPRFLDIYLDLASEYCLPVRGGEGEVIQRMAQRRVPGSSLFVRGWSGQGKGTDDLKRKILHLRQQAAGSDIIEVTTHPGYSDAYLESVTSMNASRDGDRRTVEQLAEESWLASSGLTLVSYPDFAPVQPKRGSQ